MYLLHTKDTLIDKGGKSSGNTYWLRGYSITKPNNPTTYLDADKKPLPKSIVVWINKPL